MVTARLVFVWIQPDPAPLTVIVLLEACAKTPTFTVSVDALVRSVRSVAPLVISRLFPELWDPKIR